MVEFTITSRISGVCIHINGSCNLAATEPWKEVFGKTMPLRSNGRFKLYIPTDRYLGSESFCLQRLLFCRDTYPEAVKIPEELMFVRRKACGAHRYPPMGSAMEVAKPDLLDGVPRLAGGNTYPKYSRS